MKKLTIFIISLLLVASSFSMTAYADDEIRYFTIELSQEELIENPSKVIEEALNTAKDNANYYNRYIISVPSGEYDMTKTLHIYSFTSLISQSDTIYTKCFTGNFIKSGNGEASYGYEGYTDIMIDGGVWDNNYSGTSCAMRFGHGRNLSFINLTISNVTNNHHIEMAAVSDVLIDNCIFSGYERNSNTSQEAVQLDTIHSSKHFPGYEMYDDTPCRNVTVSNCLFEDVFSGVGTRSGVIGSYFDNINIINNSFINVTNKAITCFNYRNSVISDNYINGASIGIFCEYYPTKNLTSIFYKANDKFFVPVIVNDCNTSIRNNIINVSKKASYDTSCAIGVYGGKLSSANAKKYGLISGDYTVENLNISDNIITINTSKSHGINLKYVKQSSIKNNTISYSVKRNSSYYVVNLNNSVLDVIGDDVNYSFMTSGKVYKLKKMSLSPKVVTKKHTAIVTWKKVSNATGYKIYRADKKNGEYKLIKTIKGANKLKYTDKKVKKGKKYYYKVVSYKSANNSTIYSNLTSPKSIKVK